jgi:hypothetical protein
MEMKENFFLSSLNKSEEIERERETEKVRERMRKFEKEKIVSVRSFVSHLSKSPPSGVLAENIFQKFLVSIFFFVEKELNLMKKRF